MRVTVLTLLGVLLGLAGQARAQVPLCLEVERPEEDAALRDFPRLVTEALAHHKSHAVVSEGCRAHLRVELFRVEGVLHLTARTDQQVPVRYEIQEPEDLPGRLADALSLVLHNEPAYLAEDVEHLSAVERLSRSIGQGGRNTWRVEMFEVLTRSPGLAFATGGAIGMTRGSGHWQILARAYGAGSAERARGETRVLRGLAGADVGLAWESHAREDWTFYAGVSLGLQFLRFEGLLEQGAGETSMESVNQVTGALGLRVGMRFFRTHDFDCDVFAMGYLPVTATDDKDVLLWGEGGLYTPSLQLGLGVGF
ncbi:MAG TPA: hypothetical protein PK668_27805 [Myxococcota bacterium]|nr:hypothetical protein [Myxococcota bacterium]HRY97300.1 hypothetical protein [Myxococcota bacterium]HSA23022.1 hypothetical protein [Myxococcota bacterium]